MSATTETTTEATAENNEEIVDKFKDQFGESKLLGDGFESAIHGSSNVIVIVFDWDAWMESTNFNFDRSNFSQTPTGLTTSDYGNDQPMSTIFSDGENQSHYTTEYVDKLEKVLGYDLRNNLGKISLTENRDHPMLIEEDEFDIVMAPRIPPSQL